MTENKTCPLCKGIIQGYPATSRKDNKTPICSMCGIKEALEIFKGATMHEYEKLMKKSQESREKAKNCSDVDLTMFYLNVAKGYELKARKLPVGK